MNFRTPLYQSDLSVDSINSSSRNNQPLGRRSSKLGVTSNLTPLSSRVSPSIYQNYPQTPNFSNVSATVDSSDFGRRQKWFPKAHLIKVDLSEPRDVLQSERTFLGFIRFALSLFFTAVGLILGFHLKSGNNGKNGDGGGGKEKQHVKFSLFGKVVSFLLVFLAFSTLVMAGVNYFQTVRRYSQRKIQTSGKNNALSLACVTAAVVTLVGLNVSLIVERYLQDQ